MVNLFFQLLNYFFHKKVKTYKKMCVTSLTTLYLDNGNYEYSAKKKFELRRLKKLLLKYNYRLLLIRNKIGNPKQNRLDIQLYMMLHWSACDW